MKRLTAWTLALLIGLAGIGHAAELTSPNDRETSRTWKQKNAGQPTAYGTEVATSPTDPTDLKTYIDSSTPAQYLKNAVASADGGIRIIRQDDTSTTFGIDRIRVGTGHPASTLGTLGDLYVEQTSATNTQIVALWVKTGVGTWTEYTLPAGGGTSLTLSDNTPVNTSTASAGTGTQAARDDHDHGITAGGSGSTNLAIGTRTATTVPITSSSGTDATFPAATASLAGAQSAADKTKLDGLTDFTRTITETIATANTVTPTATNNGDALRFSGTTAATLTYSANPPDAAGDWRQLVINTGTVVLTVRRPGNVQIGTIAGGESAIIMFEDGGNAWKMFKLSQVTQADWSQSNTANPAFIHNKPTIPTPSSATPVNTATAAVGTSTNYARGDHDHGVTGGGGGITEEQATDAAGALLATEATIVYNSATNALTSQCAAGQLQGTNTSSEWACTDPAREFARTNPVVFAGTGTSAITPTTVNNGRIWNYTGSVARTLTFANPAAAIGNWRAMVAHSGTGGAVQVQAPPGTNVATLNNGESGLAIFTTTNQWQFVFVGKNPSTVSQTDAEAGTSTDVHAWTPQRVGQAITALAPSGGGSVTFGAGAGEVATWAEGNSVAIVPISKLDASLDRTVAPVRAAWKDTRNIDATDLQAATATSGTTAGIVLPTYTGTDLTAFVGIWVGVALSEVLDIREGTAFSLLGDRFSTLAATGTPLTINGVAGTLFQTDNEIDREFFSGHHWTVKINAARLGDQIDDRIEDLVEDFAHRGNTVTGLPVSKLPTRAALHTALGLPADPCADDQVLGGVASPSETGAEFECQTDVGGGGTATGIFGSHGAAALAADQVVTTADSNKGTLWRYTATDGDASENVDFTPTGDSAAWWSVVANESTGTTLAVREGLTNTAIGNLPPGRFALLHYSGTPGFSWTLAPLPAPASTGGSLAGVARGSLLASSPMPVGPHNNGVVVSSTLSFTIASGVTWVSQLSGTADHILRLNRNQKPADAFGLEIVAKVNGVEFDSARVIERNTSQTGNSARRLLRFENSGGRVLFVLGLRSGTADDETLSFVGAGQDVPANSTVEVYELVVQGSQGPAGDASAMPLSVYYAKGQTEWDGPARLNVAAGESRDRFYRVAWNTTAQRTENGGVQGITFAATNANADQITAAGETAAINVTDHFINLSEGEYDIEFGGGIIADNDTNAGRNRMRLHRIEAANDSELWGAGTPAIANAINDPWSGTDDLRSWGIGRMLGLEVPAAGVSLIFTHSGGGTTAYGANTNRGYGAYVAIRKRD